MGGGEKYVGTIAEILSKKHNVYMEFRTELQGPVGRYVNWSLENITDCSSIVEASVKKVLDKTQQKSSYWFILRN